MADYSVADATRLTGAPASNLSDWLHNDVLTTDGPVPDELDDLRLSFFNIVEAAVAMEMTRVECPAVVLAAAMAYLRWLEYSAWKDPETAADRYFREDAPGFAALLRESGRARTTASRDATLKAESERFFQAADTTYRRYLRDSCAWAIFRSPASRAALIEWMGLAYTFERIDPDTIVRFLGRVPDRLLQHGGYARVGLIVVPRRGTLTPDSFGDATVLVGLTGLIERLEDAAGDTLDQLLPPARTA